MNDLSTLPSLQRTIDMHGLSTRKSLGQHFLLDSAITGTIVQYAGDVQECSVIEVGPGPGGLTRSLLKAGVQKLYVVEKDDRCIAIMQELQNATGDRLHIIHGDALEVDMQTIPAPRKIVANLPYNVGTAMLIRWLGDIHASPSPLDGESRGEGVSVTNSTNKTLSHPNPPPHGGRGYESLTLMFQKDVALRIVASPGSKDYGRLSVISQWLCECRYDMELPPEAFTPPPKVSSAVVTLIPRAKPLVDVDKAVLELVVAKAFGQRRKMLRSALKGLDVNAEALLGKAGIDGSLRAEQLDVATLCHLALTYQILKAR
jgi:16S rRNA (adenine1518-N6/adenine1519-N6)-dimethyltransferase